MLREKSDEALPQRGEARAGDQREGDAGTAPARGDAANVRRRHRLANLHRLADQRTLETEVKRDQGSHQG